MLTNTGTLLISRRKYKSGEEMFYRTGKFFILILLLVIFPIIWGVPDLPAAEKKPLVVIDPAHGGQDSGVKIDDKTGEKDITLAIALLLQKELAKNGNWEIMLTRDSDKTISLEDRRKIISQGKPDLLLSLHVNGGFSKGASGFEIYYPGFLNLADQKKQVKSGVKETRDKYLKDSRKIAQLVQKNLDTLFPRKGRGLREAETPVLEGMDIPAVVVEIGFVTNPEERKKLLSPAGQTEIAKALARSIKSFF
ncbi:MAG: N-acetylmuramoyl-L-alanine amidase AmiC precursor [Smithella sp. PtaU1.Bin162]|nr:MAG: N-acetylmuramoyl-L-alanine amidase AmiC precursor [Smithella sp. PtaU1.Bin162]